MGAGHPNSRGGDGAETLLPSRVPDLQLHFLPVDLHGPNLEIHSNCGDVTACKHTPVIEALRCPSQTRLRSLWAQQVRGPRDIVLNKKEVIPPGRNGSVWLSS